MFLVKKYIRLPASDKKLLFEAFLMLVSIKIMIHLLPIRWYAKILGKQNSEQDVQIVEIQAHILYKVSQAIGRLLRVTIDSTETP